LESILFNVEMDINCDLGEGIGNDEAIMPYLGSCNIACGGHAGDSESMKTAVLLARKHDVKIGAHPSFLDPVNFGRKEMNVPSELLKRQLTDQIYELKEIASSFGMSLHHVKPHGALYNLAAKSVETAELIIDIMQDLEDTICLYVPFNSVIESLAERRGVSHCIEVFADRNYNDDFSLVSRTEPNAIIDNAEEIKLRVDEMIKKRAVTSINGMEKKANIQTICIHGDHVNSIQIAKILYNFKDQIN